MMEAIDREVMMIRTRGISEGDAFYVDQGQGEAETG
jgi:hypothetical protein